MASLRCCVNSGLLFTIAGCLLMAIGFSTSNWLTPGTKIARLGLWEGCFNNWVYHKDYTAKSYDGCWFLLGGSFKPIWIKLSRSWFTGVQVLLCLCLVMELLALLFVIMYKVGCCAGPRRYKGLLVISILQAITGFLTAVSCLVFGVKSFQDSEWLERPMPVNMTVSWSWGLVLISAVCIIVADVFLIMAFRKARRKHDRPI